jgi:hypothetical protein
VVDKEIFQGVIVDSFRVLWILLDEIANGFSGRGSSCGRGVAWLVVGFSALKGGFRSNMHGIREYGKA